MKVIDFSRSFICFRIDTTKKQARTVSHQPIFTVNNARVLVDCRCVISEKDTGDEEVFVLGASCKTERVGAERDIWTEPNADFVPIVSGSQFMHIKSYEVASKSVEFYPPSLGEQSDRMIVTSEEAFDRVRVDISYGAGSLLETPEAVIASTLRNDPLVARTELENDRYKAVIEYPVKTMNASQEDQIYQTDTGPILFPDLSLDRSNLLGGMELSFSAFNSDSWTEFLVRCASPVGDGISVYHYSRSVRKDSVKNQIFRLEQPTNGER